jgi:hypothetical protein
LQCRPLFHVIESICIRLTVTAAFNNRWPHCFVFLMSEPAAPLLPFPSEHDFHNLTICSTVCIISEELVVPNDGFVFA